MPQAGFIFQMKIRKQLVYMTSGTPVFLLIINTNFQVLKKDQKEGKKVFVLQTDYFL